MRSTARRRIEQALKSNSISHSIEGDPTEKLSFVFENWTAFVWPTVEEGTFVWTKDIVEIMKKKYKIAYNIKAEEVNVLMHMKYKVKPLRIKELHRDGTFGRTYYGFHGFTMHRVGEPDSYI